MRMEGRQGRYGLAKHCNLGRPVFTYFFQSFRTSKVTKTGPFISLFSFISFRLLSCPRDSFLDLTGGDTSFRWMLRLSPFRHCLCRNQEMLFQSWKTFLFCLARGVSSRCYLGRGQAGSVRMWSFKERGTMFSQSLAFFLQLRAISSSMLLWTSPLKAAICRILPNYSKHRDSCQAYSSGQTPINPVFDSQTKLPSKISPQPIRHISNFFSNCRRLDFIRTMGMFLSIRQLPSTTTPMLPRLPTQSFRLLFWMKNSFLTQYFRFLLANPNLEKVLSISLCRFSLEYSRMLYSLTTHLVTALAMDSLQSMFQSIQQSPKTMESVRQMQFWLMVMESSPETSRQKVLQGSPFQKRGRLAASQMVVWGRSSIFVFYVWLLF